LNDNLNYTLILKELKEVNENQKSMQAILRNLLDRMTRLETVVMGVDGENGLRGSFKKFEKNTETLPATLQKITSTLYDENMGLCTENKRKENRIQKLETFKIKMVGIFLGAQTIIIGVLYIINKFNMFNSK